MSEMADSSLLVSVLREMRGAMRDFRTICFATTEAVRRVDRRLDDIERRIGTTGGDIEMMLKGELLGRLTHFETKTRIDERLAAFEDRAVPSPQ